MDIHVFKNRLTIYSAYFSVAENKLYLKGLSHEIDFKNVDKK